MSSSDSDQPQACHRVREAEAERFVPDRDGPDLAYEHVHRYVWAAKVLQGLRVLDLAAGSGYGARILERAGCQVTAIDLDRSRLGSLPRGLCGDARQLPFRDDCFEAVVCFEAIEHVEHPEALVEEVGRVLGGRSIFLVSTPDRTIYSDRAGHQNPYHLREMDRAEFSSLLAGCFEHVGVVGQGLWAGSWITGLEHEEPTSTSRRRQVDAARWPDDEARAVSEHAKWADPGIDELPVPVYLLGVCSNTTRGWNRARRRLSTDSVLHDPAQWLLAQYEGLIREGTSQNDALQGQIELARLAQHDLIEQLRKARETIDDYESNAVAARSSMDQLEEQIRSSRVVADGQSSELERARAAAEDQRRQIESARALHDELQSQLVVAAQASASQTEQIAAARAVITENDRLLSVLREDYSSLEAELARAHESAGLQAAEIDAAARAVRDMEMQVSASRLSQLELERQIENARAIITDQENQLEQGRRAAAALESSHREGEARAAAATESASLLEREIAAARASSRELESQVETARNTIRNQAEEIERARSTISHQEVEVERARISGQRMEDEIRAFRATIVERDRELEVERQASSTHRERAETLEQQRNRRWARLGHRIADWLDAWTNRS